MGVIDSINDKCWALLDALRLGDFWDKYRLPPLLFPLIIILIILAAFWFMSARSANPCGDNFCDPAFESCRTCVLDCGTCPVNQSNLITVSVELAGIVSEKVTVVIYDKDGMPLASAETARKQIFEFPGVEPQIVGARVSCPNAKEQTSRPESLSKDMATITLSLPEGCFDYITDNNGDPMATYGNIEVAVSDPSGAPIEALVAAVRSSDDLPEATATTFGGTAVLNVRSDNYYYLTASKLNYVSYNGRDTKFYVISNDRLYKPIKLTPLSSPDPAILRVCATSTKSITAGKISITELGGSELRYAYLTPSDGGCITFDDVPPGKTVRASLTSPPAGCASPSISNAVLLEPGEQEDVTINVACDQGVAYVKVIVQDRNGELLTDDVKVTLWNAVTHDQIPGSSPDSSLSIGSGGYTEEITIPANTLVQAKASGVPLGLVDAVSGPAAFQPNEHGSISIVLGELSRGEFEFLNPSIIYTPATPGSPFQVFVQQITYNGQVLTPQNSEVKVIIDGEEYTASYVNTF